MKHLIAANREKSRQALTGSWKGARGAEAPRRTLSRARGRRERGYPGAGPSPPVPPTGGEVAAGWRSGGRGPRARAVRGRRDTQCARAGGCGGAARTPRDGAVRSSTGAVLSVSPLSLGRGVSKGMVMAVPHGTSRRANPPVLGSYQFHLKEQAIVLSKKLKSLLFCF